MTFDSEPVIQTRPAPRTTVPEESPVQPASLRRKEKYALPAHTQSPTYKFGAPVHWAMTAKETMSPLPLSAEKTEAEALYKVSHSRVEPGQQRVSDSWWKSAGVNPQNHVFGKPSHTKQRDSVAQAMGSGSAASSPDKK
jgi:hypothetical protein